MKTKAEILEVIHKFQKEYDRIREDIENSDDKDFRYFNAEDNFYRMKYITLP